MIAISEVEQWLGCYIPLYQMRYGGSFDFHIHIEQEVRSVKLYKLLLQPVIENAILHGIRDMEGGLLQIDIGMAQQPGKIHVVVEDNGIGMEETQVKYYNQRDLEWTGEKGIGLANVFERIQLYYGKEGEWYINSVEGVGTIVELVLPVSV